MENRTPYRAQSFQLSGLNGISDRTVQMHLKLYEGYVKETNALNERIATLSRDGHIAPRDTMAYSELKRRLGFEYNGMVLHEYYFGNLTGRGGGEPSRQSEFHRVVEASFGSYEAWRLDFVAVGTMRGVGWAICLLDPAGGRLSNHWVTLHETGNVAGFHPILVMDVWEHAFLLDYQPAEKAQYIDAFFSNVDWQAVEGRLAKPQTAPRVRAA